MRHLVFTLVFLVGASALSAETPKEEFLKCLERQKVEPGQAPSPEQLKAIRKKCRAHRLLPGYTELQFQRFGWYYLLCKDFRIRQIEELGVSRVSARFESCRRLAELYVRTEKPTGKGICHTLGCFRNVLGEKCIGAETVYKNIDEPLCRRVIAPLKCMIGKKIPNSVLWKFDNERAKLNCLRI